LGLLASCGGDGDAPVSTTPDAPVPATPAPPPPPQLEPPTRIWAVEVGETFIVWEWNAVNFATGYEVSTFPFYEDPGPGKRGEAVFSETTSVRVEGLPPDTGMAVIVRAVAETATGRVEGPWSNQSALLAHRRAHAVYTLRAEVLICSDERERAGNFSRLLVHEWDGTPFRVDMVDTFPDEAMPRIAERLLEPVEDLADRIEDQLGYRILEGGEVLPPPPGWPPTERQLSEWRCPPREPGQIQGLYVDRSVGGTDGSAWLPCVAFRYHPAAVTNGGLVNPGARTGYDAFVDGVTFHEIFHVLGFTHPEDVEMLSRGIGVPMSYPLRWTLYPDADSVFRQDIDALGCVFPHPDFPRE